MSGKCGVCGIEPLGRIIEGCGRNDCPFRQRKECRGCGEMYPLSEFRRHNKAKDGYGNYCHDCRLRRRYEREKAVYSGSLPPFEQWRKNLYERMGRHNPARRNLTTRQLERLHARGRLDEAQFKAGLRYRMCWELSGLMPRLVADYGDRIGVGETTGGMPATERQAHYRQELRKADAVLGPYYARIAVMICVEDESLHGIAHRCGRKGDVRVLQRFGMRVVLEALSILAGHWRLTGGWKKEGAMRSWRAEGAEVEARPDLWETGQ